MSAVWGVGYGRKRHLLDPTVPQLRPDSGRTRCGNYITTLTSHPDPAVAIEVMRRDPCKACSKYDEEPYQATPQRGDKVEAWVEGWRDRLHRSNVSAQSREYEVLDAMLDEYREHADASTHLDEEIDRG